MFAFRRAKQMKQAGADFPAGHAELATTSRLQIPKRALHAAQLSENRRGQDFADV